jgi:electron transfer flavoprotein beta subunit
MHAIVLLKQILDWELPPGRFRIDPERKRPAEGLGPTLMGPFEQNALELALQLRDAGCVEKITALVVGRDDSVDSLRKALALRCDEAVLVEADTDGLDPSQTAELLVAAVGRLEPADLVLAGRQAGDWDHGQVGYLVAERLVRPVVGLVFRAEPSDGRLLVWRSGNAGVERLAVRPPAVLTVTSHTALRLRMGSVVDRMAANKKPVTRLTPDELGLPAERLAAARRLELAEVWVPEVERRCELLDGDDPAEVARVLLSRLEGLKLLTSRA